MPQVKCTVSNCYFWKNDFCNASEIEVAVNDGSSKYASDERSDMEIGQMGVTNTQTRREAKNTRDTCCVTFRPKDQTDDSYQANAPTTPAKNLKG